MPIQSTDCGCDFEADYSSAVGCDDDSCDSGCGENCGVDSCQIVVCESDVESIQDLAIDDTDPSGGCIVGVTLAPNKFGVRFFAKDDTTLPESEESVDENGVCSLSETITGQGRTGKTQISWMRSYKNKNIYWFAVDGCGRVRMYRTKLTRFKETTGQKTGDDLCGIEYDFTNTTKDPFQFVDFTLAGFATADEFMESLINV